MTLVHGSMGIWSIVPVGLAAWRLASLIVQEDGPMEVFDRLRTALGDPTRGLGALFGCVWCMSVWTGALMLILWWLWPPVVLAIAASSVAVLFNEAVDFLREGGYHGKS